jgi:GNAT superfamily N-acetyltransferase
MFMIKISPATPSDVADIYALVVALADYEKLAHAVVSTEADFERELFGPGARIEAVIARCDGKVAGFALFFHNFSTFLGRKGLYLEDLFVLPEFRSRGIGKALLQHLADIAVSRNCGRFEWAVLDWNAPSIAFYEAMGASVLPDWRIVRVAGEKLKFLADSAQK